MPKPKRKRKTVAENVAARIAANRKKAQEPDWLRIDAPTREKLQQNRPQV